MEGIVSKNVCVIAIAIINTDTINGVVIWKRKGDKLNANAETKFIWIPGTNPVIIPNEQPTKIAMKISNNI